MVIKYEAIKKKIGWAALKFQVIRVLYNQSHVPAPPPTPKKSVIMELTVHFLKNKTTL